MNGARSSPSEAWRMIRSYAGAGVHDSAVINPIMPRFRPIAPKPATSSDFPGSDNKSSVVSNGRRKRKYVRVRRDSGYTRKKSKSSEDHLLGTAKPRNDDALEEERAATETTLQLLPERSNDLSRPLELDLSRSTSDSRGFKDGTAESWGLHTCSISGKPAGSGRDRTPVVQAWVTVECVAGICIKTEDQDYDHDHGRITDVERVMSLERDTCPGFVSDGSNSVTLVNGAFKKMVTKHQNQDIEVAVGLVIKERFSCFYSAFTGHVKLQYCLGASGAQRQLYSRVVPCDLWRLDGGGFAWRLDVEAALTLGRT